MEKLSISQVVVVEGRYDKAKLSSLIDGVIVATNGFGIYKDRQKLDFLRRAARQCGVIILTDSDAAGFQIRNYLANAIGEGQVLHAYIPDVYGKEHRKAAPGKEGKLGVEGVEAKLIVAALQRAGALSPTGQSKTGDITSATLYEDGLLGGEGSAALRRRLSKSLGLPERLSASALIEALNLLLTPQEYKQALMSLKSKETT